MSPIQSEQNSTTVQFSCYNLSEKTDYFLKLTYLFEPLILGNFIYEY